MMHTYMRNREGFWTVGYFRPHNYDTGEPTHSWVPLEDCNEEQDARRLVNFLNGGTGAPFPYKKD